MTRTSTCLGRLHPIQALWVFLGALLIYGLVAFDRVPKPSRHLHFVDLAESFLAGRLDTLTPKQACGSRKDRPGDPAGYRQFICDHSRKADGSWEGWNDWASYHVVTLTDGTVLRGVWPWGDGSGSDKTRFVTLEGQLYVVDKDKDLKRGCDPGRPHARCDEQRFYVSFPPMPALVMLPLVAVFHYHLNDVILTLVFAAFNVLLLLLLLERLVQLGRSRRTLGENLQITLLLAFGTSLFFSSVQGTVWFTALVMGFFFHMLYLLAALEAKRPLWAGLMLAFGFATRTPLLFAVLFFGLELLRVPDWRGRIRRGLVFAAPVLVAGVALMVYNHARFGSFGEFGHTYLQDGMRPSIREHGLFSSWFVNINLSAALSNVPTLTLEPPYVHITRHGLSIFAASPALLFALWPRRGSRGMTAAWVALLAVALPGIFYQNTGWAQYSYRFSIDYLPYFALLLASGGRPLGRGFKLCLILSVLIGLFGAITFNRFDLFYYG